MAHVRVSSQHCEMGTATLGMMGLGACACALGTMAVHDGYATHDASYAVSWCLESVEM